MPLFNWYWPHQRTWASNHPLPMGIGHANVFWQPTNANFSHTNMFWQLSTHFQGLFAKEKWCIGIGSQPLHQYLSNQYILAAQHLFSEYTDQTNVYWQLSTYSQLFKWRLCVRVRAENLIWFIYKLFPTNIRSARNGWFSDGTLLPAWQVPPGMNDLQSCCESSCGSRVPHHHFFVCLQ